MIPSKMGRPARFAFALVAVIAAVSVQAAPPAHVMVRGDAADPGAAYVLLVPHLKALGVVSDVFKGVLTGRTPDGLAREYEVEVPADRPTLVRVAPGRYFFSKLEIGTYGWSLEEAQSAFDARAGQLSYPGNWNVEVVQVDLMRGARKIGWEIVARMWTREEALDLGKLDVDPEFTATLKPVFTFVGVPRAQL